MSTKTMFRFKAIARGITVSTLAVLGGVTISQKMSPMPILNKLEASETQKISRKNIEDEDGAIFLSMLSVLNRQTLSNKWDNNWDKRDPDNIVKPLKDNATEEDINKRIDEVKAAHPKAKRTIILVRHGNAIFYIFLEFFDQRFLLGQYNLHAIQDADRQLTDLGREQASITGNRLSELVKHYRSKTAKDDNGNQSPLTLNVVKSTMTRATQTADIILKHFPEVQEHQSCDLIREGAPCPPVILQ